MIAAARGGWFSRPDALAAGYSDSEVRQRIRSGQWVRMSYNSYVDPRTWPADEPPWDRAIRLHRLSIRMVRARLGPVVASHQSAAVLHGLPVWGVDLTKTHFTRLCNGQSRRGRQLQVHRGVVDGDEIVELDGLQLTSCERAIVETTCTSSYEAGVVLADAALRTELTTRERLADVVRRHQHWRGIPAARRAVEFADRRSDSVGESRLRVLMANHGLPRPDLQVDINDVNGSFVGRVDFLLGRTLVVEFDGALKYADGVGSVVAEKRREDRLRECGYGVLRLMWPDLDRPYETAARLWRALAREAKGTGKGQ